MTKSHRTRVSRFMVEQLEDRCLLSGTVVSDIGDIVETMVRRPNGDVQAMLGKSRVDLGYANGLYQGRDSAGNRIALRWVNGLLTQLTPNNGWMTVGSADAVVQDNKHSVFTLNGSTLDIATGAVGVELPVLADVDGLWLSGGKATIRFGTYFKANVSAAISNSQSATLTFSNVQMNLGRYGAAFIANAISDLQSFTKPLQPLADGLQKPLLPGFGFTTVWLLRELGYGDAADAATTFAQTITTINSLSANMISRDGWINLGGFTAVVAGANPVFTLSNAIRTSGNGVLAGVGGALGRAIGQLNQIPGMQIGFLNPDQLFNMMVGKPADLFSYTLNLPTISVSFEQQLAAIPVSPETLTEIDINASLRVSINGSATFGADTTGFFVKDVQASAAVTAGLSGVLNEADLAGFELTGEVTGTVSAHLQGADGLGKIYLGNLSGAHLVFNAPAWSFGISAKFLSPIDMIKRVIEQYGPYLKKLLGNDVTAVVHLLEGKIGLNDLVNLLDNIYGLGIPQIASILHGLDVKIVDIAGSLFQAAGKDLTAVAQALYAGVTHDLAQICSALSAVDDSVGNVVHALSKLDGSVEDLANVVWHDWNNSVNWGLKELTGALSSVDDSVSDVIHALRQFDGSISDLANFVWHNWQNAVNWGMNELAAALSTIDNSVRDVVLALNQFGGSIAQVASAVWHHWQSAASFTLKDLAGVLSSIDDSVYTVVNALSQLDSSIVDVSYAVWHNWQNAVNWTLNDLAGALSSVDDSVGDVTRALGQFTSDVNRIAAAVWNDWDNVVNWNAKNLAVALSVIDNSASDLEHAIGQFVDDAGSIIGDIGGLVGDIGGFLGF